MIAELIQFFSRLGLSEHHALLCSLGLIVLGTVALCVLANFIAKHYINAYLRRLADKTRFDHMRLLAKHRVMERLAHLLPTFVVYSLLPIIVVESIPQTVVVAGFLRNAALVYAIIISYGVLSAFLNYVDDAYSRREVSKRRPIKSYLQVAKLILFVILFIFAVATALNKSPLVLLTGLGALTAVTTLIFKDSLLGFVASIQLATYDMVRIGDWIEVPSYGADGDVVDLSLNTVKVQNFDKTIVTIPTTALLTQGVKNWRGMSDSGGRRIKRCLSIDMQSIRFCREEDLKRYSRLQCLADYLNKKQGEIEAYNKQSGVDKSIHANGRNLTNIGLFRAYLEHYLRNHPGIHPKMTFLIRQLQPTEHGLPIEIYVFTRTTDWFEYEAIQADVFDHMLAAVKYFDLRVFQDISDSTSYASARMATTEALLA